ncbi:AMP-binding protein [Kitasatospora sp. NBC_00374]|uniref:phenylacetate--CoA ligase family protein n=1 Tax=Kitasatospora sp. NBC_00374 TaxID=2975964 RepID=UPI0030E57861
MNDPDAALRTLARAATRFPHFADKYRALDLTGDFDVTALPEMTREDVTAAAEQAAGERPRPASAYLFTSGGSTAEPKLAWIPTEMHLGELTRHWQPLGPSDVLANLASPGRLWSAHYCYNRLAELAGADVIGLGYIADEELGQWLDFLARHGTTAVAGTPSQLLRILRYCERTGHRFASTVRAGIWFGEPCDPHLPELRDRVAPGFGLWGNYGSTETWVIGHNGPDCPTDTFHLLPYQHVELVDGAVLVTTLHPGAVAPVIRYRIGDRAEPVACRCGRPGDTLRIAGRESSLVKFAGTLVSPQQLVQIAKELPGVHAAQIVLTGAAGIAEQMEVRVVADTAVTDESVRAHLLASQIDLGFALRGDDEEFRISRADALSANPRTGKTPDLLWAAAR